MLIPFGVFSAAGAGNGAAAGAYELISTSLISSTTANVTFSSISQTYKHLQIRYSARTAATGTGTRISVINFNGDAGTNYSYHWLIGDGTSVTSTGAANSTAIYGFDSAPNNGETSGIFGTSIIDILNYSSTTTNKTVRILGGVNASVKYISLSSGAWRNTNAITSITIRPNADFVSGSRVSLYGIKGA